MFKKNIVKLNEELFSCTPIIRENFQDESEGEGEGEGGSEVKESAPKTGGAGGAKSSSRGRSGKNRSKRGPKKVSKKAASLKKKSKRAGKNRSKKNRSKRGPKKTKSTEGFCAGDTCLTESHIVQLINLLKKLEIE